MQPAYASPLSGQPQAGIFWLSLRGLELADAAGRNNGLLQMRSQASRVGEYQHRPRLPPAAQVGTLPNWLEKPVGKGVSPAHQYFDAPQHI